jgi:serine protease inhibitor
LSKKREIIFSHFLRKYFKKSQHRSQLGAKTAFGEEADFSSISTKTKLKVSAVSHVATVEVTTEGTVGAAASGQFSF